ncbi:MAG: flagellar hook-basal body complex protein FliE [Candidatus Cloacimonetes bacterium]|nr:flagellar hook-basal body complex protein FliE [Candidatus Cloacimonadota bacterium]
MFDPRVSGLEQMRQLTETASTSSRTLSNRKPEISFGTMMREYLQEANDMQLESDDLIRRTIAGEDIDVHKVMLATEKANITFDMIVQIRNKLLEAFKEVIKTSV